MAQTIASDKRRAILGMGSTGVSVARYLRKSGAAFDWYDTRSAPPGLDRLVDEFSDVQMIAGGTEGWDLSLYTEIVVSPGVSLAEPQLAIAAQAGVRLIGDIELFAIAAEARIAAITGSNGKSTVTQMVGEMAIAQGLNTGVGGNLGVPALDLLDEEKQLYVLELSSFQLETLDSLEAEVACILNLTQDHLDRYASLHQYHAAKQRIYRGARKLVFNRDDLLTQPMANSAQHCVSFGLDQPDLGQYGLISQGEGVWLARGRDKLLPVASLALQGRHNWANALAAYAIAEGLGIDEEVIHAVLHKFEGLPHRCHQVSDLRGVRWVDDSKATNVGACIAAIDGLATDRNVVLIAGGEGKGQDFSPLTPVIEEHLHGLVLIGEAASQLAHIAPETVQPVFAVSMEAAVQVAAEIARPGDVVLLSPACSSLDMFSNYAARGDAFVEAVEALA